MPLDKRYQFSSLVKGNALPWVVAVGGIVLGIAVAFAAVGGWLTPHKLTPSRIIDAFEEVNGLHPGFRRNHAKGVCITGSFASNGQGVALSKAAIFQAGSVPVVGRVALADGVPDIPDGPANVRSMGLSFRLPSGEEWRTGMVDIPIFPFRDAASFYGLLKASAPNLQTGKPDPAKKQAYFAQHPETAAALKVIMATPFASGFANTSFNSLDAFLFVNAAEEPTPVRWSMVASDSFIAEASGQVDTSDRNYLFDAFADRLKRGPVQWHLVITLGQAGDTTSDATIAWPETRHKIDVGTLTIDHIEPERPGNCRDINFDPLVLPVGIEGSDDPLLSARSATYAQSFRRRAGEAKTPSAVQLDQPGKVP